MERITVSLDTAKKLKEAGWEHETVSLWEYNPQEHWGHEVELIPYGATSSGSLLYPAPTASEIAGALPDGGWVINRQFNGGGYYAKGAGTDGFTAPTMQDALALLWVKLQETIPNQDAPKLAGGHDVHPN